MKQRDIELLSAYLDGQLSPSVSARLEARLKTDPELVSVMDDLHTARGYLRQLPKRRAPRNFTLTRKMVGQNPPLPRAYPAFRFATALATLLFFLTYGVNFLAPQFRPAAGLGGGGGDGNEVQMFSVEEAPALEAPAPAAPAPTEAPAAAAEPAVSAPTMTVPAEDAARIMETPAAKSGEGTENVVVQDQPQVPQEPQVVLPPISSMWQFILLGGAFIGVVLMTIMRRISARRWK